MKKIKNKFIIFIFLLIILIVFWIFLKSYIEKNKKLDSYVYTVEWITKINEKLIKDNLRLKLSIWDRLRTIWKNSIAVIEWWDWSVTRLWWDTFIEINELNINWDLSAINIKFELFSWKTWSNIVSVLSDGSNFTEKFWIVEAAVRWTIFDVDYDSKYLSVKDDRVSLDTWSWDLLIVKEGTIVDLKNFSFISLEDFKKIINDIDWEKWNQYNTIADNELFQVMKENLNENIGNLKELLNLNIDLETIYKDEKKRKEIYNKLFEQYQKINFLKPNNWELYKYKLEIKEKLLQVSDWKNKDILINSILYDFADILESQNFENLDLLLSIMDKHKKVLFNKVIDNYINIQEIPEKIKEKLINDFSDLNDFIKSWLNKIKDINLWIDDLKKLERNADSKVKEVLDSISEQLFNK